MAGQTGVTAPPMPIEDSKQGAAERPIEEEPALPKDVTRRRNAEGGKSIFTVEVKKGTVAAAHDRCAEFSIADLLDENNKTLKKKTLPLISKTDVFLMQPSDEKLKKPLMRAADPAKSRVTEYWELEEEFGTALISGQDGSGDDNGEVATFRFQVPIEFHNLEDEILARVTEVECAINPKFFGSHSSRNLKVLNPEGAIIINEND